ncbi:decarboxylase [Streptomyces sp. NPDC051320]|uniref:maleate cis-trans isomerase family protein n=1 Tax=Streptomyces sp. NPDC051320 TaxID=3154644 RepID=UPI0034330C8D
MPNVQLGGPHQQQGVGIVAPFDFALDRELWRWTPDGVTVHLTRTPFVPVEVSLDLARMVSEHETLELQVRALTAVRPGVVAYACTSGSFVNGVAGERAMCEAMRSSGAPAAVTTSGALIEALSLLGAGRVSVVTPYTASVTESLTDYLAEEGVRAVGIEYLGLTRDIWKVPYQDLIDMVTRSVTPDAEAVFISCTNLHSYDTLALLEQKLGIPVLSANQVTMWAALRHIGLQATGPGQSLLDLPLPAPLPEPPHTVPQPVLDVPQPLPQSVLNLPPSLPPAGIDVPPPSGYTPPGGVVPGPDPPGAAFTGTYTSAVERALIV